MHKDITMINEVKPERREFIIHRPTYKTKGVSKKLLLTPDLKELAKAAIEKNLREQDEKSKMFLAKT